jgi:hypothetical protein
MLSALYVAAGKQGYHYLYLVYPDGCSASSSWRKVTPISWAAMLLVTVTECCMQAGRCTGCNGGLAVHTHR